jgi:NADP-dependent 3-hydroxy acid dehydrogenase YdfG
MKARGGKAGLRVYDAGVALIPAGRRASAPPSGGRAEGATFDVRDAPAVQAVVAEVFARHGRLDHLVNIAGIGVGGEVRHLALEDWREAVEVNLMGVVHGVHAAWPRMIEQGFGHVVNTASMGAFVAAVARPPPRRRHDDRP